MVITFVMDQYEEGNNGTTMTVRRFAETLESLGHTVYVICGTGSGKNVIETGERIYPFKKIIHSQGMVFGKYNKKVILPIIKKSDVVHFLLPFHLGKKTKKLCDKLGIPTTAAFHCQPQNISSTIHLGKSNVVNDGIFLKFRSFYNKFSVVHCPSNMIRDELVAHKYKAKLYVISNGITDYFHKVDVRRPDKLKDKIIIVMTGRYSEEKRQDLLINAVKNSKYESKIQLVLCGKGPLYNHIKKLSDGLTNEPMLGFRSPEELRNILSYANLYCHCSDAEIEGMACTEAFACGLVPIISDSKKSATNQFALSDKSLFKAGDYLDLRDKIDYLIEHSEEREELSKEYIKEAENYKIINCVKQFEEMLKEVVKKDE